MIQLPGCQSEAWLSVSQLESCSVSKFDTEDHDQEDQVDWQVIVSSPDSTRTRKGHGSHPPAVARRDVTEFDSDSESSRVL